MGGVAGFIGTYLMGPRVGLYNIDEKIAFILSDKMLENEDNDMGFIDDDDSLDGDLGIQAKARADTDFKMNVQTSRRFRNASS